MPSVGLILLAAGGSRRLGTPKQLVRDGRGRSLIRRAADAALGSACRPIVAVLGAAGAEVQQELAGLPVRVVINDAWETGMASSLKAGLSALEAEGPSEAVVVMLCDQPMVTAPLLDSLIAAWEVSGHDLVACEYDSVLGVPALFGRPLFGALASLEGDQGARRIINTHPGHQSRIAFPGGGVDVDTPEDVAALA